MQQTLFDFMEEQEQDVNEIPKLVKKDDGQATN